MLKVLHLSESGLPDWRVEKSAITGRRFGYQVFFCGGKIRHTIEDTFSRIYEGLWSDYALRGVPYFFELAKKKVHNILKEVSPDLIHVHNITLAKIISKQDIPFVFDDHEYWERTVKVLSEMAIDLSNLNKIRGIARKYSRILLRKYTLKKWSDWEKDVVSFSSNNNCF